MTFPDWSRSPVLQRGDAAAAVRQGLGPELAEHAAEPRGVRACGTRVGAHGAPVEHAHGAVLAADGQVVRPHRVHADRRHRLGAVDQDVLF